MGEVNMQNKTNSPEPSSPGGIQEGAVRSRPHPESTPQAVRQRRTDVVRQRPKEPSREAARQEKPADTRQRPVPVKDAGQNRQESIPQQVVVGRPKSERRPEPRPEPVIVDSPDIDSPKATLSKKQKNSPDGKDSRENRKFYFQKFGEISTLRKMLMLVFGLLFLWCLAPAFFSIRGIGVFASSAVMLSIFLTAMFWHLIDRNWTLKKASAVLLVGLLFTACVAAFSIVSGIMLKASLTAVPSDCPSYTVVVLGCKAHGDQPSWMLSDRLEKAYSVLSQNPDVNCVVTGGKGDDEQFTEAYVMRKYLVEKGISPDRIYVEELSQSTQENMLYTKSLIELNGLSENIVVVTDRFHELRARIWAEKSGFKNIYSACCETRPYLVLGYWFREMFGLARLYVFGI